MKFYVTTFGCKVNQYESAGIAELMRLRGYPPVKPPKAADTVIINSCTVTDNAERKVAAMIKRLKGDNPDCEVILCGCFAKAYPDKARQCGADKVVEGKFTQGETTPVSLQRERTRAFLKIQDGCNRHCAYCIIPTARGAPSSRPIADIVSEAQTLAAAGHKEIVVTGINLCLYEYGLMNAVEAVAAVKGVQRVRLGSLEPDLISESDIARLADVPTLCPHFHLSLQSGSDSVLRRMNRQYDTAKYRDTARLLRAAFPTAAITTDIIAGFPDESDAEFAQTMMFAEEMAFAKIHAFAFSPREGTAAATMRGQVPQSVKRERVTALSALADTLRGNFFAGLIGTVQEVLIEKTANGSVCGHTPCYTMAKFVGECKKGDIVSVKITGADGGECVGVIA
ncbi:MAG: MiaB/RimO family radical SAM methylthiotransferase [Oscillospiraceae bacterium]|nr:MiaB/RimO family radical SAM methylthiotransferase [Oscillospiraceae bacterium]